MFSALALVQVFSNPSRVTRLIEEEEESAVFTVIHHQGALSQVVLRFQVVNQTLKFFSVISVNTDRLSVPIDPKRHANTINRFGVGGIE
tara:strand:+ start:603 stop:869 length:267 start_codon:yes stop_codon:yes gene_type:complete